MGAASAWTVLIAGALVVLATVLVQLGVGPADLTQVAALGLLVCAGALSVGFASTGTVRQLALTGAGLALAPAVVLAGYLAG